MISCKANMDSTGAKKSTSRILVVEDNPADVLLLWLALDEHKEDYRLEALQDGEEALRFVGEQRTALTAPEPCAIVLDGISRNTMVQQCCRQLGKSQRWPI
jgi:CheY-like chemotaxis protein